MEYRRLKKQTQRPKPGSWHPIWLGTRALCSFALLFLALALVLILIYCLVLRYDGLPLRITHNDIVWRYGPTLVLVVVVSLWRRVNYCVLVNQPWEELYHGPQSAAKTVLLDYLWPLQITSFITAIKFRHFSVAASIAILTLLKVTMVVSTTLFVSQPTFSTRHVDVTQNTKFQRDSETLSEDISNTTSDNGGGASSPVWDYFNLKMENGAGPYPVPLSQAFTHFTVSGNDYSGQLITTAVDVDMLHVNTTCETADISQGPVKNSHFDLALSTPSCNLGNLTVPICPELWFGKGSGGHCEDNGITRPIFLVTQTNCEGEADVNQTRSVAIAAEIDRPDRNQTKQALTGRIKRLSVASCSLQYSIHDGVAHGSTASSDSVESLKMLDAKGPVGHWTNDGLMQQIFLSAKEPSYRLHNDLVAASGRGGRALLALVTGSTHSTNISSLFEGDTLQRGLEDVISGLGHQVMRKYFLVQDGKETKNATIKYVDNRLHIRQAALGTMIALFISCGVLVFVIIRCTHSGVSPPSPSTLITSVTTLSGSPHMSRLLQNMCAESQGRISGFLEQFQFFTMPGKAGYPQIHAEKVLHPKEEKLPSLPPSNDGKPEHSLAGRWDWMPYSSRRHAIITTLCLPLLTIAALEVLWYFSENDDSFVTLSSDTNLTADSSTAAYAIRLASTGTVLLIATLFNSLDFSVATMTPLSCLAANNAAPERTLFFNMVEDMMPVALYKAIRFKHAGATFSILASTIGSGLTIAASGLWIFKPVPLLAPASVQVQAGWNLDFAARRPGTTLGVERMSQLAGGAIDNSNLVRDTLVFPTVVDPNILLPPASKGARNGNGKEEYHITATAVEPELECSIHPEFTPIYKKAPRREYGHMTTEFKLPAGCQVHVDRDGPTSDTFDHVAAADRLYNRFDGLSYHDEASETSYTGHISYLNISSDSGRSSSCPSLAVLFGKFTTRSYTDLDDYTALLCNQRLRPVKVNATYAQSPSSSPLSTTTLLDHVRVDLSASPEIYLTDPFSSISTLSYDIPDMFSKGVLFGDTGLEENMNYDPILTSMIKNKTPYMERGVLLGRLITPRTLEDLLEPQTLIDTLDAVYKQLMIRVLDLDLRTTKTTNDSSSLQIRASSSSSSPTTKLKAQANVDAYRLKINEQSKIALQCMLGVMTLLGAMAYRFTDMRGIVPRNPYPIASKMMFFEGSRLLESIKMSEDQDGGGAYEGTEMRKKVEGQRFRLGWWSNGDSKGEEREKSEEESEERSSYSSACSSEEDRDREGVGSQETLDNHNNNYGSRRSHKMKRGSSEGGRREQREDEALVSGRRFGIDILEEGICSSGWTMVERKVPAPGAEDNV